VKTNLLPNTAERVREDAVGARLPWSIQKIEHRCLFSELSSQVAVTDSGCRGPWSTNSGGCGTSQGGQVGREDQTFGIFVSERTHDLKIILSIAKGIAT